MSEVSGNVMALQEIAPSLGRFDKDQELLDQWEPLAADRQIFALDHQIFTGKPPVGKYPLTFDIDQHGMISAVRRRYESITDQLLPKDIHLWHLCGLPDCGEITHLEPITLSEKSRRIGRARWGEEEARWNGYVDFDLVPGCETWKKDAPRTHYGEPMLRSKGKWLRARSLRFEQDFPGELRKGDFLIPKCGNPDCVKASHQERLSRSEFWHRLQTERWSDLEARWTACVEYSSVPGCETWKKDALRCKGEPAFAFLGHLFTARNFRFDQRYPGTLRKGDVLLPKCGNPDCVDPAHMERLSRSEFARRMMGAYCGEEETRWKALLTLVPLTGCILCRKPKFWSKSLGREISSRRYKFEQDFPGELKKNERLVPKCGNPNCVNPSHQERLSQSELTIRNNAKRGRKGKNDAQV